MITLELCQSNSIGSRFYAPRVLETWTVETEAEAAEAVAEKRPNGLYVRIADSGIVEWATGRA